MLTMTCPQCKAEMEASATSCPQCKSPVASAAELSSENLVRGVAGVQPAQPPSRHPLFANGAAVGPKRASKTIGEAVQAFFALVLGFFVSLFTRSTQPGPEALPGKKIKCRKCGQVNPETVNFCTKCGSEV